MLELSFFTIPVIILLGLVSDENKHASKVNTILYCIIIASLSFVIITQITGIYSYMVSPENPVRHEHLIVSFFAGVLGTIISMVSFSIARSKKKFFSKVKYKIMYYLYACLFLLLICTILVDINIWY